MYIIMYEKSSNKPANMVDEYRFEYRFEDDAWDVAHYNHDVLQEHTSRSYPQSTRVVMAMIADLSNEGYYARVEMFGDGE